MKPTPVDLVLQQAVPTVMVPLHGAFEPLVANGHRFLCAADGLHLEVRRPWLYARWPVALDHCVAKPYGKVTKTVELAFGKIPHWVAARLYHDAQLAGPVEIAASVIWNERERSLRYQRLEAIQSGFGHITYRVAELGPDESLAIDLHSHGFIPAFFSGEDDADDAGSVKICGVVGSLNDEPTWAFRLCLMGAKLSVACPLLPVANLTN